MAYENLNTTEEVEAVLELKRQEWQDAENPYLKKIKLEAIEELLVARTAVASVVSMDSELAQLLAEPLQPGQGV